MFLDNFRFALRSLRKNPGFTTLAALTLALGIGANTAIFSVVDHVVLRPLSYAQPEDLVQVWPQTRFTGEMLDVFADGNRTFAGFSGYRPRGVTLGGEGPAQRVEGALVSPGHFAVLGFEPALGRTFLPEEREPGRGAVAVLSHGLWQRQFGGDEGIVGRQLRVDGEPVTVVGVLPPEYQPLGKDWEFYQPMVLNPGAETYIDTSSYRTVARLALGVSLDAARRDVRSLALQLREVRPERYSEEHVASAGVVPLQRQLLGTLRPALLVMLAAVGLVLLIACANVANLLLARARTRRREIAIKNALGAGRTQVILQLLQESLLLALLGTAAGLLLASWLLAWLAKILAPQLPQTATLSIDGRILAFTALASLGSALLFGLLPALRTTRLDVFASLKSGGRGSGLGARRQLLDQVLVAFEVALAVVLVIAAGLLLESFSRLQRVDPGFDTERVLTLKLSPPWADYQDDARRTQLYRTVRDRVAALPGVENAGTINLVPLGPGNMAVDYSTTDHRPPTGTPAPFVRVRPVDEHYLGTLGIPLLAGRPLAADDRPDAVPVGLINRSLAERLWGVEESVGRELLFGDGSEWFTIVGVVGDIHQDRLDQDPVVEVYLPYQQAPWVADLYLAVRVQRSPLDLAPAILATVRSIDPNVAVSRVNTMERLVHETLDQSRFLTTLFSGFGLLALVLGAVGVYGVTSYTVSQRTQEYGVRLALGATAESLLRTAMGRGMLPVLLGVAAGAVASLGTGRLLSQLLFEVEPTEPSVFAVVMLLLALCGAVATFLPALRAARVDPMVSLRAE